MDNLSYQSIFDLVDGWIFNKINSYKVFHHFNGAINVFQQFLTISNHLLKTIDLFQINQSSQRQIPQNQMIFHQNPESIQELKRQFDHILISITIKQMIHYNKSFLYLVICRGIFLKLTLHIRKFAQQLLVQTFQKFINTAFLQFVHRIQLQYRYTFTSIYTQTDLQLYSQLLEQIQYQMLFKGTPYVNKHIKKREEERAMEFHVSHLKSIRPQTGSNYDTFDTPGVIINNRKKQMLIETRFTQIEKANRILLVKITGIMNKRKSNYSSQQMNRSLNSSLRKKQMQKIEFDNAKMLKRLQEKKPTYETDKLKSQWKFQKNVIKNLTNYPELYNERRRTQSKARTPAQANFNLNTNLEICRVRIISGTNFLITVRLTKEKLQIVGDSKNRKQIKVIEIERSQALQFISNQCQGNIQKIFDRLRYDSNQEVLYLVADDSGFVDNNPQKQKGSIQENTQFNVNQQEIKPKEWVQVQAKDQRQ